ncbi:CorA family divalent cation transporter [Flavisphingomonas formosensis]|uniref:CorA family divalent cation transporter n=1 Tax=Flavisphingomonas formosensis TaxID=861534 RepID=UPI001E5C9C5A|nr:CorA family divalent cation transporter [Sphingomonas formosensis]
MESLPADGLRWLHFDLVDRRSRSWIANAAILPPAIRTMLLSEESHAQGIVEGDFVGGIIPDYERDFEQVEPTRVGMLHFGVGPGLLITARRHPLRSADIVRSRFAAGVSVHDAGAALQMQVMAMAEVAMQVLHGLELRAQRAEDGLLDESLSPDIRGLASLRRRTVRLHRMLAGTRTVFHRIEEDEDLPEALRPAVEQIAQRLAALDGDVGAMQARLRLLREEMDIEINQRTNQNLYLLSIMTALMLPPTLITGFFGMNTGGLPGSATHHGTIFAGALIIGSALAVYVVLRAMGFVRR